MARPQEFLTFAAVAGAGDHIVSSARLYGGTRTLLDVTLRRFGVDTTFVASDEPDAYAAEIRPETKAVYTEVIGNPSGAIADLAGLADVADASGIPLIVDATLATPYLCRPMEHGADVVVHSVTKFIGGHGTSIGGVVVESGRFPWGDGRFPLMNQPVPSYGGLTWWGNFAEYGFLTPLRCEQLRDVGATMTPFNAFLFLMGLETLRCACPYMSPNAQRVAEFLSSHPGVGWVAYAGLPDSPWHERAQRYLPLRPRCGVRVRAQRGPRAGRTFIDTVELCSHLANVGDARHPRDPSGFDHPRPTRR